MFVGYWVYFYKINQIIELLLFIGLVWGLNFVLFKYRNEFYYNVNPKTGDYVTKDDNRFYGTYHSHLILILDKLLECTS